MEMKIEPKSKIMKGALIQTHLSVIFEEYGEYWFSK